MLIKCIIIMSYYAYIIKVIMLILKFIIIKIDLYSLLKVVE